MKTKIFYLTRSYYPYQKGGGPLMRTGAVKYLKELGWDVIVVMPNYETKDFIIENDIWQIPFKGKHIQKLASLFERVGIYEDYLDKWVQNAFEYLKDKITQDDIVFATSGGELATFKLASMLKDKLGFKYIANYRDPINYTLVHGLKVDNKIHVSREKEEKKYISNADLMITSSDFNKQSLVIKYPELKSKIFNNYFGYIKSIDIRQYKKIKSNKLRIAYSGSMLTNVQKPEILYEALLKLKSNDIELYFIGNIDYNKKLKEIKKLKNTNIKFIDFIPHDEYLKFMCENIDVGFVSLIKDYYGACVPSKIYEYINLELPIIAALPYGDAADIINNNKFGFATHYSNTLKIADFIKIYSDRQKGLEISKNIHNNKEEWSMKERIKELDNLIRTIL